MSDAAKPRAVLESVLRPEHVSREDGGMALIAEMDGQDPACASPDGCFFVRLQSWDENNREHPFLRSLIGRRVRVTVEAVD